MVHQRKYPILHGVFSLVGLRSKPNSAGVRIATTAQKELAHCGKGAEIGSEATAFSVRSPKIKADNPSSSHPRG